MENNFCRYEAAATTTNEKLKHSVLTVEKSSDKRTRTKTTAPVEK